MWIDIRQKNWFPILAPTQSIPAYADFNWFVCRLCLDGVEIIHANIKVVFIQTRKKRKKKHLQYEIAYVKYL